MKERGALAVAPVRLVILMTYGCQMARATLGGGERRSRSRRQRSSELSFGQNSTEKPLLIDKQTLSILSKNVKGFLRRRYQPAPHNRKHSSLRWTLQASLRLYEEEYRRFRRPLRRRRQADSRQRHIQIQHHLGQHILKDPGVAQRLVVDRRAPSLAPTPYEDGPATAEMTQDAVQLAAGISDHGNRITAGEEQRPSAGVDTPSSPERLPGSWSTCSPGP